jgi:hypothetical protein
MTKKQQPPENNREIQGTVINRTRRTNAFDWKSGISGIVAATGAELSPVRTTPAASAPETNTLADASARAGDRCQGANTT